MKLAPSFTLKDSNEKEVSLSDFKGKNIVLYFYPRDNTPGCTIEAIDFSKLKDDFKKHNTIILGVSKDTCKSHQNFIDKRKLTINLLSDQDSKVQKQYDVWKKLKFMGREYLGTQRTTFLINKKGEIVKTWEKVSVNGHAKEVLEEVKKL